MILHPGDIVLVSSKSWLSKAIRFFERRLGEPPSHASHVGIIVSEGDYKDVFMVEALNTVKHHAFYPNYVGKTITIYHPLNLSPADIDSITFHAKAYIGRTYGYMKIVTNVLDWFLFNAFVFRRLTQVDKWPICSWVVAKAFESIGRKFGVEAGSASPDDVDDFCQGNPDKYECIHPLGLLK